MNHFKTLLTLYLFFVSTVIFAESLEEQCKANDFSSCAELGKNYYNGTGGFYKSNQKAFFYYEKACTGNNSWGCEELGVFYEAGLGVRKNPQKADQIYEKTCFELKRGTGCKRLADSYFYGHNSVLKNHKKALELYEKTCRLNNSLGSYCFLLGAFYEKGENQFLFLTKTKVKPNIKKAFEIYGIGCDNGDAFSCKRYSKLYGKIKK